MVELTRPCIPSEVRSYGYASFEFVGFVKETADEANDPVYGTGSAVYLSSSGRGSCSSNSTTPYNVATYTSNKCVFCARIPIHCFVHMLERVRYTCKEQ